MTTAMLRIVGKDGSRLVTLGHGVLWAGRSQTADIRIDDPEISRKQFSIELLGTSGSVSARVSIQPDSPNGFIMNGRSARDLIVQPGDTFSLGSYRFELRNTESQREALLQGLPNDPAGTVTIDSADAERRRIAPEWQLHGGTSGAANQPKSSRLPLLVGLLIALCGAGILGGYGLGWFDAAVPKELGPLSDTKPDLLKAVPKLECDGLQACLTRAADSVGQARKLQQGGSRDLMTLYRIARHYHRAFTALGDNVHRIPDLADKYDAAKTQLETAFGDLYFRLKRSITNENRRDQLSTVRAMMPLCAEDPHDFCHGLELFYKRVND